MLKLAVLAMVAVAMVMAAPAEEEGYKSRLDAINVDEVLANKRLLDNFVECFLKSTKCTPDARTLKEQLIKLLPEILESNCAKCKEDQKVKVRKILKYLHDNRRADYDVLLDKYDPNKELRTKYKEKYSGLAKEEGFADIFD